jgi:SAM-dependent methyltransferase
MREKAQKLMIKHYLAGGQIPWSSGYNVYREHIIVQTLGNLDLMSQFKRGETLPTGYGYGLDERCVEYPWLFAQLDPQPEQILDAGSTLNHQFLLDQPIWPGKNLHILTLAPENQCYWQRGISYLFADLRQIPLRDNYYDTVVCISTLEHIGCDNSQFTGSDTSAENRPRDFLLAVGEMRRTLKPSGRLLLTVPFGRYRNIGTQQVFDEALLEEAIAAFRPATVTRTFFSYTEQGWQFAAVSDCRNKEYVDWIMLPRERRPPQFPKQTDGAAAARAVACVKLEKVV